jgi:hypothetical protein
MQYQDPFFVTDEPDTIPEMDNERFNYQNKELFKMLNEIIKTKQDEKLSKKLSEQSKSF